MKNVWKIAFFTVVILLIMLFAGIATLLFRPIEETSYEKNENVSTPDAIPLEVKAEKKDLNNLIEKYIEQNQLNGPIDYSVFLTDEIELYGTMAVFAASIDLKMTFDPKVLENGDLLLKQKSISLGSVNLPVPYVLKFIRDGYKMPEWVKIQPNDEAIYVALTEMNLKSGLQVKGKKFDLVNDEISFMLYVPDETIAP
ncbi:YpmS family protein [Bacillus sp. 2205SS5-2]|uniref:YpmS family protein n=1 Tax=Bacillus sp. 2205SS5-2 TaxID=3109031 RepID=UPI0030064E52